jgi:murein L,D-transpeptidase YcbB/YkuD
MQHLTLIGITWILSACETLNIPYLDATNTASPHYASLSIADKNYAMLQKSLPLYENAVEHPWPTIPDSRKLTPGTKDKAVLALRARLIATNDLTPENDKGTLFFDNDVTEAVIHFQRRHGLTPDGVVGQKTLYQLNISPEDRLQQIQVNMERWAKLSGELKERYIMVNVPAYRLDVVENGQRRLSMRAVVGKPERPTPEIQSTVTRLVLNPTWNVPKMIAQEDIVPKVIQDPDYLDRMNIKILEAQTNDAGFQYHFRQEPGEQNALGLVKFEFQNTQDVYMHDTPAKNLFDLDNRAYSSGCIRLERPFDLAAYLLKNDSEWDNEKIQMTLNEGKTTYVKASNPTQVVITYLTTWVDDGGNLQFRDDIYGLDRSIY